MRTQLGHAGLEQRFDLGHDHVRIFAQGERSDRASFADDLPNVAVEDGFELVPVAFKARGKIDRAGTALVEARDERFGRGASVESEKDGFRHIKVVLDDAVAERIAGCEGEGALVPTNAVHDALARLRRQCLQNLVRSHPAELDDDRAHFVTAPFGFGEKKSQLAFVDETSGAKQGA